MKGFGAGKKLPEPPVKKVPVEASVEEKKEKATVAPTPNVAPPTTTAKPAKVATPASSLPAQTSASSSAGSNSLKKKRAIADSDSEDEFDVDDLTTSKVPKKANSSSKGDAYFNVKKESLKKKK
jgi:hypothetical protein